MADRKAPQADIAAWTTDRSPVRGVSRPPAGQDLPHRASRPPSGRDLPRYSYDPNASLTAYHPTIRDRIARWMLGDDYSDFRRRVVLNTVGSVGLGSQQLSAADFIAPVGMAFSADETARALDYSNYRNAATSAIGLIPWGRVVKSGGKLGGGQRLKRCRAPCRMRKALPCVRSIRRRGYSALPRWIIPTELPPISFPTRAPPISTGPFPGM